MSSKKKTTEQKPERQTKKETKGKPTAKAPTAPTEGKTAPTAKKRKSNAGRPPVITEAVVKQLEEAFSLGASDRIACGYAGISKQTLYNYCEAHPEFVDRKEGLKQALALKCLVTLNQGVQEDPELALKVLERRSREDFAKAPEVAVAIENNVTTPEPKGLAALTIKELAAIAASAIEGGTETETQGQDEPQDEPGGNIEDEDADEPQDAEGEDA